jgi:autotransporter-associated beta strand protein
VILAGTLRGSGNINVVPSGAAGTVDAGPGFRLRGTGASDFSGTITLGNRAKAEMQTTVTTSFSPAGSGKFVLTGGTFTGALAGDYSQLVIRNNSSGDAILGNNVEVTGTGLVVMNMIGSAPAGSVATLGNLKIADGQTLGVDKNGAPTHTVAFTSVTLGGGNATFAPTTFNFGSTGGGTADLSLGAIGQSVPGSGIIMDGQSTTTITGTASYTGATAVNRGTLRVTGSIASSSGVTVASGATFNAAAAQSVKTLTISNGGLGVVGAGKVLKVGDNLNPTPLVVDGTSGNTAKLDLTSGGVAVDVATPGAASTATNVLGAQIVAGYNASAPGAGDGTWNGNGITSSTAAAAAASRGVGYALASDVFGPGGGNFMGTSVDGTTALARYTLLGDANLDGTVNFNDLVNLAQNYNVVDGTRRWYTGDFTYDGNTNFNDLVKLAQNYNASLPTDQIPGASATFEADLARAFASVPEPTLLAPILLGAAGVLTGRRRNRSAVV